VAGEQIHNQFVHSGPPAPSPDTAGQATRECPQCRSLTWAYNARCHHCQLDMRAFDRRSWWSTRLSKRGVVLAAALFMLAGVLMLAARQAHAAEPKADMPLELKVASVDAGYLLDSSDSAVARMRSLLNAIAEVYRIKPIRAADMAAALKKYSGEHGRPVTIAEALDWALIACEHICSEKELAQNMAEYAASRNTGQTHHQAIHGLVILKYLAKVAAKHRM